MKKPSLDQWLEEAKTSKEAEKIGMYLTHTGVVRATPRASVREGVRHAEPVSAMKFSYDASAVEDFRQKTLLMDGIYYVRLWLNEGLLNVGDELMYILIGGDIRPHVMEAMDFLIGHIKSECVSEQELFR